MKLTYEQWKAQREAAGRVGTFTEYVKYALNQARS